MDVQLWRRLNHPNILPFYGASLSQDQFSLVSPWMENGNVLSYTRKHPEVNRLQLVSTDERLVDQQGVLQLLLCS